MKLLQLLAFLDRTNLQDEIFRLASLGIGKALEMFDLDRDSVPKWLMDILEIDGRLELYKDVRKPLIRRHLLQEVQAQEGWRGVTMHALVQWRIAQDRVDTDIEWFVTFITAELVQMRNEDGKAEFRRHFISHLDSLSEPVRDCHNLGEEGLSSVVIELANLLYYECRWSKAEQLEVSVMETRKRVLGQEHPSTLISMGDLGLTDLDRAIEIADKAVSLTSDGRNNQLELLKNLRIHLFKRYLRTGEKADLDRAIALAGKAVRLSEGTGWISMDVGHIHIHGS